MIIDFYDIRIGLPPVVAQLVKAREAVMRHYRLDNGFGFSGRIIGDIGELAAVDAFGLKRASAGAAAFDATTPNGRTVQIKTTVGGNASYSYHPVGADHLIFLDLDLPRCLATVLYNGPERPVRASIAAQPWPGTRPARRDTVIALNETVPLDQRLPRVR